MKRVARFARKFSDGIRTMWGCEAKPIVKILVMPMMIVIVFLCCVLDLIDRDKQ